MKNILIISAPGGSGHRRAAEAIQKEVRSSFPKARAEHIDLEDYVPTWITVLFFRSYEFFATYTPHVWGYLYSTSNTKKETLFIKITQFLYRIYGKKIIQKIKKVSPDTIICTHFTPAAIINTNTSPQSIKKYIIVTDFSVHAYWFGSSTDTYCVSSIRAKDQLISAGIPECNIHITGIPIDPIFYKEKNIHELKKVHNVREDSPVFLVLSGGKGLVPTDVLVKQLCKTSTPKTIVSIAGNNKRLEKKLASLPCPNHITHYVIGWTSTMDDYMRMADVIITKPGGITTAECIALQKPIVAVFSIPGQEVENAELIREKSYGVVCNDIDQLEQAVHQVTLLPRIEKKEIATQAILRLIFAK